MIGKTKAKGGQDIPEDLQGALFQGLKLNWRKVSVKICHLCTDAPCHGQLYHSVRDHYKAGSPANLLLEDLVEQYSEAEIDLTVYELGTATKPMFGIMEQAYDKGKNKGELKRILLFNPKKLKMHEKTVQPSGFDKVDNWTGEELQVELKEFSDEIDEDEVDGLEQRLRALNKGLSLENAYAANVQRDLEVRAERQYAKHGWI